MPRAASRTSVRRWLCRSVGHRHSLELDFQRHELERRDVARQIRDLGTADELDRVADLRRSCSDRQHVGLDRAVQLGRDLVELLRVGKSSPFETGRWRRAPCCRTAGRSASAMSGSLASSAQRHARSLFVDATRSCRCRGRNSSVERPMPTVRPNCVRGFCRVLVQCGEDGGGIGRIGQRGVSFVAQKSCDVIGRVETTCGSCCACNVLARDDMKQRKEPA